MFQHPAYAGTYAFGRFPVDPKRSRRDGQTPCVCHAPEGGWAVTIHDCLPANITWDQYRQSTEGLRQNRCAATSRGHARRGLALLSGLVMCGRRGQRMNVLCGTATRPGTCVSRTSGPGTRWRAPRAASPRGLARQAAHGLLGGGPESTERSRWTRLAAVAPRQGRQHHGVAIGETNGRSGLIHFCCPQKRRTLGLAC
jgi:hypothetical protein